MVTVSEKVQTYVTIADRVLTFIGSVWTAEAFISHDSPIYGLGIASIGIGLAVFKYAESPTFTKLIDDITSRVKAVEDIIKPKQDTSKPAP